MLDFFKKLLGLPTQKEVEAARAPAPEVPYKVEPPVINNKTGDVVDPVVLPKEVQLTNVVTPQVTDAVAQPAPVKKTRKPRVKKEEVKPVAEVTKPAAMKRTRKTKKA